MPRDGTIPELPVTKAPTPFDGPIDTDRVAHIGCMTLQGQLTEDEQATVVTYVEHFVKFAPAAFQVTARDEATTTVSMRSPGIPEVSFCMSNDGRELMITSPVRTRRFDPVPTSRIINALHTWRHEHGSPESNAIRDTFASAARALYGIYYGTY